MANYDLFIFHGHGDGDNGASGNGFTELERVRVLTTKVVSILTENGLKVHTNNGANNYNKNLTKGNTYNYKFGYTLHLNSGGGDGAELITPRNEAYLSLDFNILNRLEKLGFKSRGVKGRDYDSNNFFMRTNGVANRGVDYYGEIRNAWSNDVSLGIIECCFIDNKSNIDLFNKKIDEIAYAIADEILKYCGRSISKPTQSDKIHRVQVGAFKDVNNAKKLQYELKQKGYDAIIV